MRNIMYMLVVIMLASSAYAQQAALKVDFGNSGSPVQEGYQAYAAGHEVAGDFITQNFEEFGTIIGVTPTWAEGANNGVRQMLDRGENKRDYGLVDDVNDPAQKDDLIRDWIGSDTRVVGDPLTITISGLPAGMYTWVSYHHDTDTGGSIGTFDVTVNDATGSVTTTDVEGSSTGAQGVVTLDAVATFEATIVSDGTSDVSLVFDNQNPDGNTAWNESWFCMNGFDLTQLYFKGAATDPVPFSNEVDSETVNQISWSAPVDNDLDFVDGYDVYFGTIADPNVDENPMTYTTDTFLSVELDFNTTYYWRVDTHVTWLDSTSEVVEGLTWQFTTLPDDKTPIVTAADTNVITSMEFLPVSLAASVNDWGEGDIVDIIWTTDVAINEAMQMLDRSGNIADLDEIVEDPNLLVDWIGTDTRDYKVFANPMSLTLKGLPAATYSWKSYHHDASNQSGTFDVTVIDANGSAVFTDNVQTNGATAFVPFETTITTNGTDDVVLVFELQVDNSDFFVMNGFELTDGGASPLKIDFEPVLTETVGEEEVEFTRTMPGYQSYTAEHEVADTFIEKSFAAFGTNVSIVPEWSEVPMPVDMVNDPKLAAQAATLSSEHPVAVTVTIKATDSLGQAGSASIVVTIAADACAGAQLDKDGWSGFNTYDFNSDCLVNVEDLAVFAAGWLDDRNLSAQK